MRDERVERGALVGVDADVASRELARAEWNRRAREVESVAGDVGDDFHDIATGELLICCDRRSERGDLERRVALQRIDQSIDVADVDERFIALDVDDLIECLALQRFDFADCCGDAIGARLIVTGRTDDAPAECDDMIGDPRVIRCDINGGGPFRRVTTRSV